MKTFAIRLKELRKLHDLTLADLAKATGLAQSTLSMYENGQREPGREAIETIADYFNVDIDYILGRDDRSTYYIDPVTAEMAQELYENPSLRLVFDASKNLKPEDIEIVVRMIKAFKNEQ